MASSALSALRTRVANALGGRTDLNTEINSAINEAITELDRRTDVRELTTTSVFTTDDEDGDTLTSGLGGDFADETGDVYSATLAIPTGMYDSIDSILTVTGATYGAYTKGTSTSCADGEWWWASDTLYIGDETYDLYDGTAELNDITVVFKAMYAPPSALKTLLSACIQTEGSDTFLGELDARKLDWLAPYRDGEATGTPALYLWHEDDIIELFPRPDDAYDIQLRYYTWSTAATTDADTFAYTHMDDVIVAFAISYMYDFLQEELSAQKWEQRAEKRLEAALERRRHSPNIVRAISPINLGGGGRVSTPWARPSVSR